MDIITCKKCKHHNKYDDLEETIHSCNNYYARFTERIIRTYPKTPDWCRLLSNKNKGEPNV